MNKFQFGQKVLVSTDSEKHAGKAGVFQLESTVGKQAVAIIACAKTGRQFKVNLEHVQKAKLV